MKAAKSFLPFLIPPSTRHSCRRRKRVRSRPRVPGPTDRQSSPTDPVVAAEDQTCVPGMRPTHGTVAGMRRPHGCVPDRAVGAATSRCYRVRMKTNPRFNAAPPGAGHLSDETRSRGFRTPPGVYYRRYPSLAGDEQPYHSPEGRTRPAAERLPVIRVVALAAIVALIVILAFR